MVVEAKMRWGDMCEEEDGEYLDFLLPPRQVIGTGDKVKMTTTSRVRKVTESERRSWPKFGDAAHDDVNCTIVSTEEILLDRPGTKAEDAKGTGDSLAQLGKGGAVLMVCRTCSKKGDHWTSRCPYKDVAAPSEGSIDKPEGASGTGKGTYVPPSQRAGAERSSGSDMRRRNDENSVRVTNLSEDTSEPDLHELFRPFGAVSRVYVAVDQKNGMSRGFGFVNFVNKEDAQRAINKLNGYGYDNLILRVEWATPRPN